MHLKFNDPKNDMLKYSVLENVDLINILILEGLPNSIEKDTLGKDALKFVQLFYSWDYYGNDSFRNDVGKITPEMNLAWKNEKCSELGYDTLCVLCNMQQNGYPLDASITFTR